MRPRSLRLFALLLLASGVAGCDQANSNLFPITLDGVTYTFSFQGREAAGETLEVRAQAPVDLMEQIRSRGFGPEAVVRARLEPGEAQVRILRAPSGVDITFLDAVSLRLAGGGTSVDVASQDDFDGQASMLNEADLEVGSENIAPVITAGDVEATLTVAADPGIPDDLYRLEVRFNVIVEVEDV